MIRASYAGALARFFEISVSPWHCITILPDAQGQNDSHAACAAELPGICDVNLVSHTMGDGISPSAWSRGVCKHENPTQGAPARAECPTPAAKSAHSGAYRGQNAQVSVWRTRPVAWTSRRRNRFLNVCLRLLTPAPFPPLARALPCSRLFFNASCKTENGIAFRIEMAPAISVDSKGDSSRAQALPVEGRFQPGAGSPPSPSAVSRLVDNATLWLLSGTGQSRRWR